MPRVVRVVGIDVEAETPRGSSSEAASRGNPILLRVNAELEGVLVSRNGEAVVDVVIDIRLLLREAAGLVIAEARRVLQSAAAIRNRRQQVVGIDLGVELSSREAPVLARDQVVINAGLFVLALYTRGELVHHRRADNAGPAEDGGFRRDAERVIRPGEVRQRAADAENLKMHPPEVERVLIGGAVVGPEQVLAPGIGCCMPPV